MAVVIDKNNMAAGGSNADVKKLQQDVAELATEVVTANEIKEIMEDLPDGQAVSAQVALNTTKLSELEERDVLILKADYDNLVARGLVDASKTYYIYEE